MIKSISAELFLLSLVATASQAQTCTSCRAIASRLDLMKICRMDPNLPSDRQIYLNAPWDLRLSGIMMCDARRAKSAIDRPLWNEMDKCLTKFAGSNKCQ